jgi:CDP-glucose 4,6-dehydratase
MENLALSAQFWAGRRVMLTGHTGFKGGWLALWLGSLGAEVYGYALDPVDPCFFSAAAVRSMLAAETIADLKDFPSLSAAFQQARPEVVLHLAAQPLVRRSYADPSGTYLTNVMGTLNVLEAVRQSGSVKAVVVVTTDKCYENHDWEWGYREIDPLGGYDPYSSSKACAELLTASWRNSFLREAGVAVATARAGNVLGGGDWAEDRLVPDFLRALDSGSTLQIRSPASTRPWQHVLEPLAGYMELAARLYAEGDRYAQAWNFGPHGTDVKPVKWIVDYLTARHPQTRIEINPAPQHEANTLKLDISKALQHLSWAPCWHLGQALDHTLDWHAAWKRGEDMRRVSLQQIQAYCSTDGSHGAL